MVAALLAQWNMLNGEYNYYTQQQIFWANKYTDSSAAVKRWETKEDDWYEAKDNAEEKIDEADDHKYKGYTDAVKYANDKVGKLDEIQAQLDELTELDINYETQKEAFNILMTETKAQMDAINERLNKDASENPGSMGGG